MRAKYVFFSILISLVMFLTGILSGHYYAYYQWGEVYQEENQPASPHVEEVETEEEHIENDLEDRQEAVRESESSNFFSQLGQTIGGGGPDR